MESSNGLRALIADDDPAIRDLLQHRLGSWGYNTICAEDGRAALRLVDEQKPDIVISDWMMPGMDGLELCRRIRAEARPNYVYIILLTARNTKTELIAGMQAGADDFIGKPFGLNEVQVRLSAGSRIVRLEKSLRERNAQLKKAFDTIERDLREAARLQTSLLPRASIKLPGCRAEWLFRPSAYVSGDLIQAFALDERRVGFYLLDVAGHGVTAAMLSMAISEAMAPPRLFGESGEPMPPADVLHRLNIQFFQEDDEVRYFTIVYGVLDIRNGRLACAAAGHPPPFLFRAGEPGRRLECGGPPLGLFPEFSGDAVTEDILPGDRLLFYSDGIIECFDPGGEAFGTDRLRLIMENAAAGPPEAALHELDARLEKWRGSCEQGDDVSALLIDWMSS